MNSLCSGSAKVVRPKASFPHGAHRVPDEERRMLCAQILRKNHLTSDFFQVHGTQKPTDFLGKGTIIPHQPLR